MPLKFLPYLRPYLRDRHVQGVHLLDLWGLFSAIHQLAAWPGRYKSSQIVAIPGML